MPQAILQAGTRVVSLRPCCRPHAVPCCDLARYLRRASPFGVRSDKQAITVGTRSFARLQMRSTGRFAAGKPCHTANALPCSRGGASSSPWLSLCTKPCHFRPRRSAVSARRSWSASVFLPYSTHTLSSSLPCPRLLSGEASRPPGSVSYRCLWRMLGLWSPPRPSVTEYPTLAMPISICPHYCGRLVRTS